MVHVSVTRAITFKLGSWLANYFSIPLMIVSEDLLRLSVNVSGGVRGDIYIFDDVREL